jgi:hypothetical protein
VCVDLIAINHSLVTTPPTQKTKSNKIKIQNSNKKEAKTD